jgi:ribosomal protein S18 acetylase RimI-like enzyme
MITCVEYSSIHQEILEEFCDEVFAANGFSFDPINLHKDLRNINKVYVENGGGFWLLIEDYKVVGAGGLKLLNHLDRIGELKCLYVRPAYQGKGLGQQLVEKIKHEAKIQNLRAIRLDVKTNAHRAIALYKKNGFYDIERYNTNTNDVVFMEMIL